MLIDDAAAAPAHSRIVACIPARFGSTRLPGKPLRRVGGVPLVVRVHAAVTRALADVRGARVVVVTDDARIEDVAATAGAEVWRHDAPCPSGTQRILRAAAARGLSVDALLNVQGDQPFVTAAHLGPVLGALAAGRADRHALRAAFARRSGPPRAREGRVRRAWSSDVLFAGRHPGGAARRRLWLSGRRVCPGWPHTRSTSSSRAA
jgi:CTP:molybdopterin cytidylyltransferase MocA